jgi:prepilin-type N-terminal cleavage/methylation domain-containing protein/prepilin-type processing-associated H-X9-DG protein
MNRLVLSLCVLSALPCAYDARAQGKNDDPSLKSRFLREALASWKQYEEMSKRLQGRYSFQAVFPEAKVETRGIFEWRFNDRCSYHGAEQEKIEGGKLANQWSRAAVINPDYGFVVKRKNDGAPWTLAEMATTTGFQKNHSYDFVSPLAIDMAVRFHKKLLTEILTQPEFRLVGCRPAGGERQFAEVEFEFSNGGKEESYSFKGGKVLLDPRRCWTVQSYEAQLQHPSFRGISHFRILEWASENEPMPLPKVAVIESIIDNSKLSWRYECDLALPARLPADAEFYLAAFGFPEPPGIKGPSRSPMWYVWFMAGGFLCLAAGAYALQRRRRQAGREILPPRSGFALVELLVVIAIIGVLIALVLPAVQKVRDNAQRSHCSNNLRQIGLAAHQYHDMVKSFPAGMRYKNGQDPYRFSTWLTHLLPYIEQDNLWEKTRAAYEFSISPFKNPPHVGLATVIGLYACPADGRAWDIGFAPMDQIDVAFTSYLGVEGKDFTTQDGVFYVDSWTRMTDISDGTSQTLLAGERPPSANLQFGWWYAGIGQRFTGSADSVLGVQEQNVLPLSKAYCPSGTYAYGPGAINNQCDMFHFWSLHPGGAHFLFADGSVHFLGYEAAPILPALASRANGDMVGNFDY